MTGIGATLSGKSEELLPLSLGASVRDAITADLPAIVALLAADTRGELREVVSSALDPAYIAAFQAIETDPNQRLLVLEQAGEVVGTMQLSFIPGLSFKGAWRGQIEAVRIAASLRGQGLGARFVAWAVEACRQRGCHLVQLTSNLARADAHRFYERLGFTRSHAGFKLYLNGEGH